MKIFVVEPRGSGGMIHYAYQLCNSLADAVDKVTLVTSSEYELDEYPHKFKVEKIMHTWGQADRLQVNLARNSLEAIGLKLLRGVRRVFRGLQWFVEWIKLIRYLQKNRPDIVQFGSIEFPFESIFLQYLKHRGLILTQICHEFESRERSTGLFVRLNNYFLSNVFKAFSAIFFHSASNQERFQYLYPDIQPDGFHVIPMGNGQIFPAVGDSDSLRKDLMLRYRLNEDDLVVLFFGNITSSKGIPDLIRAFPKVSAESKNAKLVIAGKPLKYINTNDLLDLVNELGIHSVTRFDMRYLSMEEAASLITLATVVVYPYINSTQSASVQAAYAFGKPVIATRVGGLPDLIEDGKSGFLVPPNSPGELSSAILKLICNPELAKKMGQYARELSETRFAWGPIASQIALIYRDLLVRN